jgi:hypothetical protein
MGHLECFQRANNNVGGIELSSLAISASSQWQLEIDMVFQALGKLFDFYTDESCSCHVDIKPGPSLQNGWTLDQLVRVAQGAFFWENGLCDLLPHKRHSSEYAKPNWTVFATNAFQEVPRTGWGRVFDEIESTTRGRLPQPDFLRALAGGANPTRNLSTCFTTVDKIGTVELRRQAGAASSLTVTHRILLALTLHISALRYDFNLVRDRKEYTTGEELLKELAGCIKKLPDTCHGTRFVAFLKWSLESYADGKSFTNKEINEREEALRLGKTPPHQISHRDHAPERPSASSSQATPAPRASNSGGAAPPARQGGTTAGRAPAPAGREREATTPAAARQGGTTATPTRAPASTTQNQASQASHASPAPRPRAGRGG